jgi:hypothetical protein
MGFISRNYRQNFRPSISLMCAFLALMCVVASLGAGHVAFAEPAYTINYQGKLADNTGLAVANGTYAMSFALYTQASGGAAIWSESRTGGNEVTVQNGLFSVMLGEVASLAAVNFNQTLYLGITIESDGEMTPRKPLGSVPSAFEAKQLGGVASSSFLRSDAADTASGLLTFTGGFQSLASSTITSLTTLTATTTNLVVNGERFTDLTGTGLALSGSTLTATLGTDIAAAEIANGDHGFFSYASGVAALDTGGLTSADLLAALTNETGTGSVVFSASPTFTGTLNAAAATLSSTLTMSGSAANIALGSNYLSGDGGDEGVFVDSSGNVGIGTTTANSRLSVQSTGTSDILNLFETDGSEVFTVLENGNVGLGSSTPTHRLTIFNTGNPQISVAEGTNEFIRVGVGETSNTSIIGWDDSDSLRLGAYDSPTDTTISDLMTILSTGKVGIGTTTPSELLHLYSASTANLKVSGDASVNLILSRSSNNASNPAIDIQKARGTEANKVIVNSGDTVGGLNFMGYDGAAMQDAARIRGAVDGTPAAGDMPGRLMFYTTPDGSVTSAERMRINASGNIGIGTTTPNQRLSIFANAADAAIEFSTVSGAAEKWVIGIDDSDGAKFKISSSSALGTSDRFVINGSGNVGIGTASPSKLLHVYGVGDSKAILESSDGGAAALMFKNTQGDVAVGLGSDEKFHIGNDGTNPGGGTWLTIDSANGNVGIGTTSPYAKLSVAGHVVASYYTATSTTATSTLPRLSATQVAFGGDYITDFTGTGLALSGSTLTATLGTDITAAEIANGNHGFFSYSAGVASLDTGGLTSANLSGALTDETGSGVAVFATSPTLTTPRAAIIYGGTAASSQLTLRSTSGSGTTDDIIMGVGTNGGIQAFRIDNQNSSIAFGKYAGSTFTSSNTNNVAIGRSAGEFSSTTNSSYNNIIGYYSGYYNTGSSSTIIGSVAGYRNSGDHNNLIGGYAGGENAGDFNNLIGDSSGWQNSGDLNNFFGNGAGALNTGDWNTFFGDEAGGYLQSTSTVAIGADALRGSHATDYISLNNVAVGYQAGYSSNDGSGNNILIGYRAADNLTTGNNNIVIGYDIDNPTATTDNSLNIGNLIFGTGLTTTGTTLSRGNIGIGTSTPGALLHVVGKDDDYSAIVIENTPSDNSTWHSAAVDVVTYDNTDTSFGGSSINLYSYRGTKGAITATQLDDKLGGVDFYGGVSSWAYGANVEAYAEADFSSGSYPTQLRFSTTQTGASSPTRRMTIQADGKVGIADSTPSQLLDLDGTNVQALLEESTTEFLRAGVGETANTSVIGWDDSDSLRLGVYSSPTDTTISDLMTILSTGNVGIGTTTPNQKLTVQGNINLSSATGAIYFDDTKYLYASSTNDSIVFGENAGASFTSGTGWNVAIGYEAGRYASTSNVDRDVFIGYQAGYSSTGGSSIFIGDGAGGESIGPQNIIFGLYSGFFNEGFDNNIFGTEAGYNNSGDSNSLIGYQAGYENTGSQNNLIGEAAGYSNTGTGNNLFGLAAGLGNAGDYNNLLGVQAGNSNTGDYNNIFGWQAGNSNVGDYNNFLGYAAGYNNNGDYNDFIGYQAGTYLRSTSSVAFGGQALYGSHATTYISLNNVAVGYRAGYASDDGSGNNILLGYQAADNLTTGNNNIIIGYDIDNVTATADNRLNIGNLIFGTGLDGTGTTLASGNVGIGTTSPSAKLDVYKANGNAIGIRSGGSTNYSSLSLGRIADEAYLSIVGVANNFLVGSAAGDVTLNNNAGKIMLGYSSTPALTINASNFVGIGTTTPETKLNVFVSGTGHTLVDAANTVAVFENSASTNARVDIISGTNSQSILQLGDSDDDDIGSIVYDNSTDALSFRTNNTSNRLLINSSGNVGIGTTTPAQKLQVYGNIRVGTTGSNGCIEDYGGGVIGGTCSSDERLKENIEPIATEGRSYLESLAALTPVTYNWNDTAVSLYGKNGNVANLGLVAQDVEALFPELVSRNEDGFRQVDFRALPFYIIEAMKELWAKVRGHDERLQELEQDVQKLGSENEYLKNRISDMEDELDIDAPPPDISSPEASSSDQTAPTDSELIGPIQTDPTPTESDPIDAPADPAPADPANDNTAPIDDLSVVGSAGR